MLSILIPTYNYNIQPLIFELQKQAEELGFNYEIIIGEDDITSNLSNEHLTLNEIKNIKYYINPVNFGRAKNRNELVNKSKFDLLLFLDVDTFPTSSNFLKNYIAFYGENNPSLVFGGLKYQAEKPEANKMLRWVYGNEREAVPFEIRIKEPFKTIFLSNLLIKKEIMINYCLEESIINYGYEDALFFTNLKKNNISASHINNPVYHFGLESNTIYLKKVDESLVNLKTLIDTKKINGSDMNLVNAYLILKKYKLTRFFSYIFKYTKLYLIKKITNKNPSLFFFDLYRLGYLCNLNNLQSRE